VSAKGWHGHNLLPARSEAQLGTSNDGFAARRVRHRCISLWRFHPDLTSRAASFNDLDRGLERIGRIAADKTRMISDDPRHQRHPCTENVGAFGEDAATQGAPVPHLQQAVIGITR
jgi:hypothetical protein